MTLRKKALLLAGIALAVLTVIFVLLARVLVLDQLNRLEEASVRRDLTQAVEALIVCLLAADVLLGGALWVLADRLVLSRLERLRGSLTPLVSGSLASGPFAGGSDRAARVPVEGRDGLSDLAGAALCSVTDAIVTVDENQTIVLFNQAAEAMFGCAAEVVIGQSLERLLPERLRAFQGGTFKALAGQDESHPLTTRSVLVQGLRADGTEFPMEVSVSQGRVNGQVFYTSFIRDVTLREQARAALEASEAHYRTLVEYAPEAIAVVDEANRFIDANANVERLLGLSREELLRVGPMEISPPTQPDGRPSKEVALNLLQRARSGETPVFEWVYFNAAREETLCEVRLVRLPVADRQLVRVSVVDITARRRAERLLEGQHRLLEQLAGAATLNAILEQLVLLIESLLSGLLGSVLLLDRRVNCLFTAAAPSLPATFVVPPGGIAVGPEAAACGRAAYRGQPWFATDIATDPAWAYGRDLALAHGLRACWSIPITSAAGEVMGTFAMYFREPRSPVQQDLDLIAVATHIAGIAIENRQAGQALAEERNLLRTMIDILPDAVYVKDVQSRFLLINESHARLLGVAAEKEVIGKTDYDFHPAELAAAFYADEQRVLESGQPLINQEETAWSSEDGTLHTFLTTKMPLRDGAGNVIGIAGVGRDITALKRVELALAGERNLLRTVIDYLPDMVYAKDAQSRFILSNVANQQALLAASMDEVVGKSDFDFYPAEMAAQFFADEQRVMQAGQPLINREEPGRAADGTLRRILTTKVPLRDGEGHVVGIVGIGRDITERVQMEEALRASENLYRTLIEQSSDMIYLTHKGRFVIVNPAFEEAFGLTLADLQAPDFDMVDIVAPQSRALVRERGQKVREGQEDTLPSRYEFTALRKDGTPLEVEASVAYLPYKDGAATQGILRDITERKAAEMAMRRLNTELEQRVTERTAEIRRQHQRIQAILDSVADAVIMTDRSGAVVLANPVARQLLAETPDQADVSRRLGEVVARLASPLASWDTEVIEVGKATYGAKAAKVVEDGRELGTVVVLRDITRLLELDRLKTQFVDTVSHELRTPLANIRLYLSLLRRGRADRHEDYLQIMEQEAARLERLILDVLDLSRLESAGRVRRESVDMEAVIAQVVEHNTPQAEGKRLTLTYRREPGDSPPMLWADRDQMVQMLTNIVANAIWYTPEGGSVTVRSWLGRMTMADDESGVEEAVVGDLPAIVIEVSDTGIGISPEDMTRIFDRFYRGRNAIQGQVPGTGLGLAIAREIVERHYGRIGVESRLNEGSAFRVYLPLTASDRSIQDVFTQGGPDDRESETPGGGR